MSQGKRFKQALGAEKPLQLVGCINAYSALLARENGFRAIYLSGAGVANASFGLPDLGMTSLSEVLDDVRRITSCVDLPLFVDADTGWGSALGISRTVKELVNARAAGMHIEDQVAAKRCGHRPNKAIVSAQEMCDRIKSAVDARTDDDFVIMARTDALANEGLEAAISRAKDYVEAGADAIFPEAVVKLEDYQQFAAEVNVPVLANITEFGKTPLFTLQELAQHDVAIALYPLSAFRAMSNATQKIYQCLRSEGSQQAVVSDMQTRNDLYKTLGYEAFEAIIDKLNNDN